jgi:hypothetical protein
MAITVFCNAGHQNGTAQGFSVKVALQRTLRRRNLNIDCPVVRKPQFRKSKRQRKNGRIVSRDILGRDTGAALFCKVQRDDSKKANNIGDIKMIDFSIKVAEIKSTRNSGKQIGIYILPWRQGGWRGDSDITGNQFGTRRRGRWAKEISNLYVFRQAKLVCPT